MLSEGYLRTRLLGQMHFSVKILSKILGTVSFVSSECTQTGRGKKSDMSKQICALGPAV